MFEIGETVIVNTENLREQPWNGFVGKIVKIDIAMGKLHLQDNKKWSPIAIVDPEWCSLHDPLPTDEEIEQRDAVEADYLAELTAPRQHAHLHIPDIDSGLGIGGINNDQSLPAIPSIRAIERVQHLMDTDIICRRCGASKNFDGAMFTTGGGDICDDCF